MSRRDSQLMFWGVTAVALILRVIQVQLLSDATINPHWLRPVMDAGEHDLMARGILAGDWPGSLPFFTAPLYPYFLAALYAVFGVAARLPVQLVHALVSAFGAGLVGLLAAGLWGRRAGWLAGLLLATAWTSILFAGELLAVSLTVTLTLLVLWLLLAPGIPGRLTLFWSGLAWGVAAVARANILILAPVFVWYLVRHRSLKVTSPNWIWLALGLLLPILPVAGHNILRGGDFVPLVTSGGVNFYVGNNSQADGMSVRVPGTEPTRQDMFGEIERLAEAETGRLLRPSQVDRHFLKKGLTFWREHPGQALSLQLKKVRYLLAAGERSNNKNIYFWRERSQLLKWPIWPGWALVLVLAAVGFGRRDLDRGARFLLLGSVVFYAVALTFFFVNARFRLPVLAILAVPAGGGLEQLWVSWHRRRWDVPAAVWGTAIALLLVSCVPDWISFRPRDGFGNPAIWSSLGNSYLATGDAERAVQSYRQVLLQHRTNPRPEFQQAAGKIYIALGDLLSQQGRQQEVLQLYSNWVSQDPGSFEARVRLGEMYLQTGQLAEAASQFQAVLAQNPEHMGAKIGHAWILLYRGEAETAGREFEAAHRHEPNPHALFGAGLALMQQQKLEEAERAFREVLTLNEGYWQAWGNLADIYEKLGDLDRAGQAFRELLKANPQDQVARQWLQDHAGF